MIENVEQAVRDRRSVRSYDERPLSPADREKLCTYMKNIENPYGLPVELRLLEGMSSPVVVGSSLFVAGKLKKGPHHSEAFGYAFEKLVLYAQSLGIGTVWIGGTMDRADFEKAVELAADEVMPCVSPLGYPAKKMSLRETMMRKGVKADERMAFEKLVFDGDLSHPMTKAAAGALARPLEAVVLAPSAVNKQPWRMVVCGDTVHFYIRRAKGFNPGDLDMQMVDMGIALCHFDLVAKALGMRTEFVLADPGMACPDGEAYVASYRVGE